MKFAKGYSSLIVSFLESDLTSFEKVCADPSLQGKLGIGMVTTACAAFDAFSWLLFYEFSGRQENSRLIKRLLYSKYFNRADFIDESVFYKLVRCGVVHQFFPKGMPICVVQSDKPIVDGKNGIKGVNAIGFYRTILNGLKMANAEVQSLADDSEELRLLDLRLEVRRQMDREEMEKAFPGANPFI